MFTMRKAIKKHDSEQIRPMLNFLWQYLDQHAQNIPHQAAITKGSQQMSFAELKIISDQIGGFLYERKKKKQEVVFLYTNERFDLVPAIAGVNRSGNVFVVIDPDLPAERIRGMTKLVKPDWIITDPSHLAKAIEKDFWKGVGILLWGNKADLEACKTSKRVYRLNIEEECRLPKIDIRAFPIAYIYFSSGSTGTPKAIPGLNQNIIYYAEAEKQHFDLYPGIRICSSLAVSFAAYLRYIAMAFVYGGTFCIPENDGIFTDPSRLLKWLHSCQIEIFTSIPQVLRRMARYDSSKHWSRIKYLFTGGDKLNWDPGVLGLMKNNPQLKIINNYGQTEIGGARFYYFLHPQDAQLGYMPIGRPMCSSIDYYILDKEGRPAAAGVKGELHISAPFSSPGYANNRVLNKKVFISIRSEAGRRISAVKTGDMVQELPNGNLVISGREDHMVNRSGTRIELEEIEAALMKLPGILECVAVQKARPEQLLVAYYASVQSFSSTALRRHLLKYLPAIMVPGLFVRLPEIPLTANGKPDRPRLRDLMLAHPDKARELRGKNKQIELINDFLLKICKEVLPDAKMDRNSNFFSLGCNSLDIALIVSRISQQSINAAIRDLYKAPTISRLAQLLAKDENNCNAINDLEKKAKK